MYTAATEIVFQTGHYLTFDHHHQETPHRHDWRVRVTVVAEQLDRHGLVFDFNLLNKLLTQVAEPLGQVENINELPPFTEMNPSTENLARYIHDRLQMDLPATVRISEVMVWETDCHRAGYQP